MKKKIAVAEVPYWKQHIPKVPENKTWKRDAEGYPIFHDSGECTSCKGEAKTFSTPWHAFKYQLLGYCEPCIKLRMADGPGVPDPKVEALKAKKPVFVYYGNMHIDHDDVAELERLAEMDNIPKT